MKRFEIQIARRFISIISPVEEIIFYANSIATTRVININLTHILIAHFSGAL